MIKFLIIFLFLNVSNKTFANYCVPLFADSSKYEKIEAFKTLGFPASKILDVERVMVNGKVYWNILHLTRRGFYLTQVNSGLEAQFGHSVDLSKGELHHMYRRQMDQRLLDAGLTLISERSGTYRMSEPLSGNEFIFVISKNSILEIYKKLPNVDKKEQWRL